MSSVTTSNWGCRPGPRFGRNLGSDRKRWDVHLRERGEAPCAPREWITMLWPSDVPANNHAYHNVGNMFEWSEKKTLMCTNVWLYSGCISICFSSLPLFPEATLLVLTVTNPKPFPFYILNDQITNKHSAKTPRSAARSCCKRYATSKIGGGTAGWPGNFSSTSAPLNA